MGMYVDITYNYADDKFYYRGTSNKVTHLNMYDDPGWLEPTAPQNFICKNSTSWGNNPKFEWERPEHPKRWSTTLYYHIYRKVGDGNYIQLNATATLDTSFTDSSATLDKFGNTTYYYVTAKGSDSPESDPSDVVQIKTNLAEKSVPGDQQFNFSPENNIEDMSSLSIYPNPFNPITHISYYLPHDSYVQMVIYNITGQKIEKLVNGYQYRGEYAVNFNGQSLAGGIYFIRLISNEQMITKKVLLFK